MGCGVAVRRRVSIGQLQNGYSVGKLEGESFVGDINGGRADGRLLPNTKRWMQIKRSSVAEEHNICKEGRK